MIRDLKNNNSDESFINAVANHRVWKLYTDRNNRYRNNLKPYIKAILAEQFHAINFMRLKLFLNAINHSSILTINPSS